MRVSRSLRNASMSGVSECRIDSRSIGFSEISSSSRSRTFERVRTRSTVVTSPCLSMITGLTDSSVPIAACVPLIRPPFRRYSSVSRAK